MSSSRIEKWFARKRPKGSPSPENAHGSGTWLRPRTVVALCLGSILLASGAGWAGVHLGERASNASAANAPAVGSERTTRVGDVILVHSRLFDEHANLLLSSRIEDRPALA